MDNKMKRSWLDLPARAALGGCCACCVAILVIAAGLLHAAEQARVGMTDLAAKHAGVLDLLGAIATGNGAAPLNDMFERQVGGNRAQLVAAINGLQQRVIWHDDGIGFTIDPARHAEAAYLLRRMKQARRASREYARVVVDIGANDGFLSSNSYALVQMGWSSVLLEPNPNMMDLARKSQSIWIDPYGDGGQTACYLTAGMTGAAQSTKMTLELSDDAVTMESSLRKGKLKKSTGKSIQVDVLSVADVVKRCPALSALGNTNKRFGLLSVDAEGVGDTVLHAWLDAGWRPEFVIYEPMHNKEPSSVTTKYMEGLGYALLRKVSWDYVYEYQK